jgi:hypothetical protein
MVIAWLLGTLETTIALMTVLFVLILVGSVLYGVGLLLFACVVLPIAMFIGDTANDFHPGRLALVIGVAVGLFLIRWYLPLIALAVLGIVFIFIEVFTSGR